MPYLVGGTLFQLGFLLSLAWKRKGAYVAALFAEIVAWLYFVLIGLVEREGDLTYVAWSTLQIASWALFTFFVIVSGAAAGNRGKGLRNTNMEALDKDRYIPTGVVFGLCFGLLAGFWLFFVDLPLSIGWMHTGAIR